MTPFNNYPQTTTAAGNAPIVPLTNPMTSTANRVSSTSLPQIHQIGLHQQAPVLRDTSSHLKLGAPATIQKAPDPNISFLHSISKTIVENDTIFLEMVEEIVDRMIDSIAKEFTVALTNSIVTALPDHFDATSNFVPQNMKNDSKVSCFYNSKLSLSS